MKRLARTQPVASIGRSVTDGFFDKVTRDVPYIGIVTTTAPIVQQT